MERVAKLRADWVSISAASVGTLTIGICYYLAVRLGHVPAWLPMISDCAVNAPEKYPFRVGMIVAPCLIFINATLFYFYVGGSKFGGRRVVDKVALVMCGISAIGLMIVGAVNEQEDNSVHSAGALVFFIAQWVFELMATLRLRNHSSKFSVYAKAIISVGSFISLALFAIYSGHWGKYHIRIAVCEWCGVLFIMAFHLSFACEFKDEYVCELITSSSSTTSTSSSLPQHHVTPMMMNNGRAVPLPHHPQSQFPVVYYYPLPSAATL
eukprot:TRINITY_DN1068_c0_g1_i1.p1 TRINITY_DN1068_c0_g1~~TRINITY_DN1068_c0_g1_i1.p1  ORF type:complete len:267 (+),score=75.14 TRINITY_DN1068_c0_g1_i1:122-922(+)